MTLREDLIDQIVTAYSLEDAQKIRVIVQAILGDEWLSDELEGLSTGDLKAIVSEI